MAERGLVQSLRATIQRARRAQNLIILMLMFLLLTIATAGVSAVLTGPNWTSLWESLLLGLLFGWGLALFHLPAWRSALLVVVLGFMGSFFIAGGLHYDIHAVFKGFVHLAVSLPTWIKTHHIDLTTINSPIQQLFTATGVVLSRVISWLMNLGAGQAIFDPVAAGIVWSLVVWLVSAWAGWVVEAGYSAIIGVLPALSLNLITLSYGHLITIAVYLLLGLALVLTALVQYGQRQQEWDTKRVAYPQRKGGEVRNLSLVISISLVILAAFIASLSLRQIVQWTSELNRPAVQPESGLAKSLGIQQPTPVPDAFSAARSPGLPRDLLIGAVPKLSKELVMSVQVSGLQSQPQASLLPPFYWRSFTYDRYTGHGWSSSATEQTQYQPNQSIQANQLPGHEQIQEVVNLQPDETGTLYAAGEPVSANISTTAAWRTANDLFGVGVNMASYSVQSLIPVVNEDDLRAAGQVYPTWVTQRYLTLPPEVPDRVRQLAIQLTATAPTPYDRAHAIEQYLRNTYAYSTDVPHPPANQDLVDYFLFDLRKGYCDYFASAMIVLARAAGIPARLAVGFASGTYNLNSGRFLVTEADAHSWVEVYFPGMGWVPFEPTAALPTINRSAHPNQPAVPTPPSIKQKPTPRPAGTNGLNKFFIALGLLALAGFVWVIFDEYHLRKLTPQHAAAEIYQRLRQYGNLLKIPQDGGQTPDEIGQLILAKIMAIVREESQLLSHTIPEIQAVIQCIVLISYRPSERGETLKIQLLRRWRSLRWQLRLAWIFMLKRSMRQILLNKDAGASTGAIVDGE